MALPSLLALAIGLAMDATAVAAAAGLATPALGVRHCAVVALLFGGFQAAMPLLGWLLARSIGPSLAGWGHWIAFAVLGGIGAKMIHEARAAEPDAPRDRDPFAPAVLLALAVATSLDAFAAGITLPVLGASPVAAIGTIGAVTAVLSAAGLALGHRVGARFGRGLEVFGGVVLIGLGVKILVEHLVSPSL
ncbi:MAG TPA: manganese efflux pump MntP family protein [Kofleriaceae bacterium]|nr:manganese efflux pump MntP family protein [Kofleriaceae bacterium]